MYLATLRKILGKKKNNLLFPCIKDLVANGLRRERFIDGGNLPSRQDLTQFLAAWFKQAGVSQEECRPWMIEYCSGVLSAISSSSKSQIRHSTKSNIKYIYKSDIAFDCRCENNRFKASCERTCLVYDEMAIRAQEQEVKDASQSYETRAEPQVNDQYVAPKLSIKETYKEQFNKAMDTAHEHWKKETAIQEIVDLLNDRGFKTRTGKQWSYSILQRELQNFRSKLGQEQ